MSITQPFDPGKHISRLNGKDYLEVKWRLVWLRDSAPDSRIRTECIHADDMSATFKASVTKIVDGEVKGEADGHGSETKADFRDFLEKAETKAIGRALAALGYGTQFCDDHNFGVEQGRVVDTPVQRPRAETTRTTSQPERPVEAAKTQPQQPIRVGPGPSSEAQHKMLWGLAKETNPNPSEMSDDRWLHGQIYARFQIAHLADLSKQHASQMITWFKNGDFIDCKWPPQNGRVDPVEANQQAPMAGMPEEPSHLRDAPMWN